MIPRLLLAVLALAAIASPAQAAIPDLGQPPHKECGGLFGPASSGCVASEPLAMDDTQVGDVTFSPHTVALGETMTMSVAWSPGWRPTTFSPPGTPVTPCPPPPLDATSWSCTMTMNGATNAYVRRQVNFCCFNAREQDYYAVVSEGRVISGTVRDTHPADPDRTIAAFPATVSASVDGKHFSAPTSKGGEYSLLTDDGEGKVRTNRRHCVRPNPPCRTLQTVGSGRQRVDFEAPAKAKVSGTVRNLADQPIAGITVRGQSAGGDTSAAGITGLDGRYEMLVPKGSTRLYTDSDKVCIDPISGDCQKERTLDIQRPTTQDWRRTERIKVSGRVTQGTERKPVENIEVRGGGKTDLTDADGKYELEIERAPAGQRVNVQAGETGLVYRVAQGSDCRVAARGCDVSPDIDRNVDFQRIADPRFTWNVVDECSSPDEGCGDKHFTIELDGSKSEAPPGRRIVRHEWEVGGVRSRGEKVKIELPSAAVVPAELTTQDDAGDRVTTRRVIDTCDGDSISAPVSSTKGTITSCFGLKIRLRGRRLTREVVQVDMFVDNDGDDELRDLEFSGDGGLKIARGENLLRRTHGPHKAPPRTLAPKSGDQLKYAFQIHRDGVVRIVAAVSARSASGREMTASSVVNIKVANVPEKPGQAEETMINGDISQAHIEGVRRRQETEDGEMGMALAKRLSANGKATISANEEMMAQLLGKANGTFAYMDEAAGRFRGPDGKKLSFTEAAEVVLAGMTSRGAGTRGAEMAKQAVRDFASAPDQIANLVAGPELKALQRIGGVAMNITNREAWNYLGQELSEAKVDYLNAASRRSSAVDIYGVGEAMTALGTGAITPGQALETIFDKTQRTHLSVLKGIGAVYDASGRFTREQIDRADRDPVGFLNDVGETTTALSAYVATDLALSATTGGASKLAKADKLAQVARRAEREGEAFFRGIGNATDVRRISDLPVADLPALARRDVEGLAGFEAKGYGASEISKLQAVTRATEDVVGSQARGRRLVAQVKEGNPAAYLRDKQGVSSPKSQVVANKTGTIQDLRVGMSDDALGFANFTRPPDPGRFDGVQNPLAKLINKVTGMSDAEFARSALRRAEFDEFFNPGAVTRTGNAAYDAEVAAQRSGLVKKMEKLRQATSPQGLRYFDEFGNATDIKLTLERTKDGRSVLLKTERHTYGDPVLPHTVGRPGSYQGLDNDVIGFVEEDLLTGQKVAIPPGLKGQTFLTWFNEARKRGVSLADHPQSFESPDMGAGGAKVSLKYTLEALSASAAKGYVERDLTQLAKRCGFRTRGEFLKWLDRQSFDTWTVDITSDGGRRGTGFAPR